MTAVTYHNVDSLRVLRINPIALYTFFAVFLIQGLVISVLRILDIYIDGRDYFDTPLNILSAAIIITALIKMFMRGKIPGDKIRQFSILIYIFLLIQILIHGLLGGEEIVFPVEDISGGWDGYGISSWNTRFDEYSRSFVIFSMYIIFFITPVQNYSSKYYREIFIILKISCFSVVIMTVIVVFQSINILPNLYFQWHGMQQIGRPAGGMTHPHYYSAIASISMVFALFLFRAGRWSLYRLIFISSFLFIGIILSTSRIGMVFGFIVYAIVVFPIIIRRPILFIIFLFACISFIIIGVYSNSFSRYISVFFSFLDSPQGILRGRASLWGIEWGVVSSNILTFLFGYGYQPIVSHNLILRQLQVSGLIGTALYFLGLFLIFITSIRSTKVIYRTFIYLSIIPIVISSVNLPILVSITVNSAILLLWMCILIESSYRNSVGGIEFSNQTRSALK